MTKSQIHKIFLEDLGYSTDTLFYPKEIHAISTDNDSFIMMTDNLKMKLHDVSGGTTLMMIYYEKNGQINESKPDLFVACSSIFNIQLKA